MNSVSKPSTGSAASSAQARANCSGVVTICSALSVIFLRVVGGWWLVVGGRWRRRDCLSPATSHPSPTTLQEVLALADAPAAVHGDDDAGDQAGVVAAQPGGRRGTVLRPARPARQGLLGLQVVLDRRVA